MVQRVFYVTQGSLRVWSPNATVVTQPADFADDEGGFRAFERYLASTPDQPSVMLIDVIEEEFALDKIPKLGARDRVALIERRAQRKFRRTPYRVSQYQGKSARNDDEYCVVHSAISNHELVDPWLTVLLDHKTPLSGVYSVPLMAAPIVNKLFSTGGSVMFIAPHQGNKLRQVFLQDACVRSARLSQGPGINAADYAQFVLTEITRSRRYLERTRLLSGVETLQVCVIADDETAEKILSLTDASSANHYQFVRPDTAARKLKGARLSADDRFEEMYLEIAATQRPKHSYARSGENRYWWMHKARNAIIATASVTAAACSVVAAVLLSDTWILNRQSKEIQSQVEYLSETFRRENQKFDPIKADSHEMQAAVNTGDFLLANRVPVPWVMNQLGAVLGDYPDVQLQELRWRTESLQTETVETQRRGEAPAPLTVPAASAVSAVLTADIVPFDGDMRRAFSRIDELAADIETRSNFHRAETLEYPFDASTNAAVSGEIVNENTYYSARFRLRVYFDLDGQEPVVGDHDEST